MLELDEEANELVCVATYDHEKEIWALESSPSDPELLFTMYNTGLPCSWEINFQITRTVQVQK